ncbi:unnamed protein product [Rotaria magnacalcarata]|uniref:Uncharacterized protein n=2 Tax=Rotaria magnacalcarata TaxID=392030 RepID=A0A816Q2M2_9BILA|nr:unnamed protein product [Rotaria magnacalcarata]CAF1619117.1 unnamed protein product [Rotaria magnacalcarata]CAF1923241.1 unnamed protein product [Rotaria magnacalcarata]CAF2055462.1 unnamed protein product [Rotaria magnacalcarata]CAF3990721.1 unnamed protein product [Rotaria magnacalcarata]
MTSKERTIVFIPGYQSVVPSTKSIYLEQFCQQHNLTYVTFNHDFSPESSVETWYKNFLCILKNQTEGQLILVGSSLGVWLALLLFHRDEEDAVQIRSRICGIVGVGTSVNSTERWLNEIESEEKRIDRAYVYRRPSLYSSTGYYDILVAKLLDSKEYILPMESGKVYVNCSVIMLHGICDTDVPYHHAIDVLKLLDVPLGKICELRLIHDGDHRLSRQEDLIRIHGALLDLISFC